ncbi:unnamed protein product [Adineta ricciae]|uniref:Uncharacterized protein n=1 Tax=Adineta ricciae TaxID=249248 RepID=A0A814UAZ0_ADIRI|nr:unnamed protein product [Adineta ricciae]
MASNQTKIEHWLGMNVTLFKESDIEKRNRELTGATDVHNIYTMITVHTGCCELALTTSLVERLDLEYFDTVSVSSSTDNNDRIKRYGPVLPSAGQREGAIAPLKFFCRPADDCFSLNLISIGTTTRYDVKVIGCDANIKRFEDEYNVKIHLTNEGSSKMIFILSAKRFDVDLDFVALAVTELNINFAPYYTISIFLYQMAFSNETKLCSIKLQMTSSLRFAKRYSTEHCFVPLLTSSESFFSQL